MSAWAFTYHRSVGPETYAKLRPIRLLKWQAQKHGRFDLSPLLQQIDQGYGQGDVLCDAWAQEAMQYADRGMGWFERALQHGIDRVPDAPAALVALFRHVETRPDWVDPHQLKLATQTLSRYPILQSLILQSISLMGGYVVPGLTLPLLKTGSLTHSVVPRLARTLLFAGAVTYPYGMDLQQAGFQQAVRVRLIHTWVRQQLRQDSTWDQATYGVPINQSDLIATNMTFSLLVIYGLRLFGSRLTSQESEAVLHLWRYIGYVMGLSPDLMPTGEAECARWFYAYLATQKLDPTQAKPLAQSLDQLPLLLAGDNAKARWLAQQERNFRAGLTRALMGDDLADRLGLPRCGWAYGALAAAFPVQTALEIGQKRNQTLFRMLEHGAEAFRNRVRGQYVQAAPELKAQFDAVELALRHYESTQQAA